MVSPVLGEYLPSSEIGAEKVPALQDSPSYIVLAAMGKYKCGFLMKLLWSRKTAIVAVQSVHLLFLLNSLVPKPANQTVRPLES